MIIGCPKEIKNNEYRVGIIPVSVASYVQQGHTVYVEQGAGIGSSISDQEFEAAGATIVPNAQEVWGQSDMIIKVKEPLPDEYELMQENQLIYTYFHFAASETLTKACLDNKITALAYETVQEADGSLPLLKPMSEVAGRMAPLMGSFYLTKTSGGRGILPTGVPGVMPAYALVIGGGTVGSNAARVAAGLGARVSIMDINMNTLEHLGNIMPANVFTVFSNKYNLENALAQADMVIGAVLIPGAKAPKIITRQLLSTMKPGAVFVDVAIDQGGCAETSRPTTHSDPVYEEEGVIHYCVANMPGAYARSSTFALNNVTLRYGLELAGKGVEQASLENPALMHGLNIYQGTLSCMPVAEAFGLQNQCTPAQEILS